MNMEQLGSAAGASTATMAQTSSPVRTGAPSQATLITGSKAVAPAPAAPGTDEVRDAVKKIEQAISPTEQGLRFSIDEDTGTTVVKLIDTETQLVLRQIPTLEILQITKALDKLQGLLIKDKA